MPKNIVICSDGTGNSTIAGRGTNVFKLFEAVDLNGHRWDSTLIPQVAFYDDGVGSENFKPLRLIGGVAGWGLSHNVRQLYKELARVYDPGDQIFMFGFSRGAFTVRSLTGMIGTCGLVHPRKASTAAEFDALVDKAYAAYRACYRTTLSRLIRGKPHRDVGARFREEYAQENQTPIRFLGVWDTVDAVGLPFHISDVINSVIYRFKFPDPFLGDGVVKACHALAIDDERHSFHPLVWHESVNGDRIEQVWFPGVHSNVGGGYHKQGLSLVALDWMMAHAERAGLRFNCRDRELYRDHASLDDKLYDSRAGFGTFYRWKLRDIEAICARNHMPVHIHISALERIAHGVEHYAPANLPPKVTVVVTPSDRHQDPSLITQRAVNIARVCNDAFDGRSLLASLRGTLRLGHLSYYVFLLACTAASAGVIVETADALTLRALASSASRLIVGLLGSPVDTTKVVMTSLMSMPWTSAAIALALLLSSVFSRVTDRRISNVASAFWYGHQPRMREALKRARITLAPDAPAAGPPLCWASAAMARPATAAATGADHVSHLAERVEHAEAEERNSSGISCGLEPLFTPRGSMRRLTGKE